MGENPVSKNAFGGPCYNPPVTQDPDTTMGGDLEAFPATTLSVLAAQGEAGRGEVQRHLERLTKAYWKPIYCFIRRVWSKNDADAKDLTQSFIVHVLEHDLLARFDQNRGNFRSYLKQCLRAFLSVDARDAGRLKRGGHVAILPIEGLELPAAEVGPDEEFDQNWTREVVERSLADVGKMLREQGKAVCFEVFRQYSQSETASYQEVGRRLGLSETDVHNHLRMVRKEMRRRVLQIIGEYVVDQENVLIEAARILGNE